MLEMIESMDVTCNQIIVNNHTYIYVLKIRPPLPTCSTDQLTLESTSGGHLVHPSPAQPVPPRSGCPGPCQDGFCKQLQGWRNHSLSGGQGGMFFIDPDH